MRNVGSNPTPAIMLPSAVELASPPVQSPPPVPSRASVDVTYEDMECARSQAGLLSIIYRKLRDKHPGLDTNKLHNEMTLRDVRLNSYLFTADVLP